MTDFLNSPFGSHRSADVAVRVTGERQMDIARFRDDAENLLDHRRIGDRYIAGFIGRLAAAAPAACVNRRCAVGPDARCENAVILKHR